MSGELDLDDRRHRSGDGQVDSPSSVRPTKLCAPTVPSQPRLAPHLRLTHRRPSSAESPCEGWGPRLRCARHGRRCLLPWHPGDAARGATAGGCLLPRGTRRDATGRDRRPSGWPADAEGCRRPRLLSRVGRPLAGRSGHEHRRPAAGSGGLRSDAGRFHDRCGQRSGRLLLGVRRGALPRRSVGRSGPPRDGPVRGPGGCPGRNRPGLQGSRSLLYRRSLRPIRAAGDEPGAADRHQGDDGASHLLQRVLAAEGLTIRSAGPHVGRGEWGFRATTQRLGGGRCRVPRPKVAPHSRSDLARPGGGPVRVPRRFGSDRPRGQRSDPGSPPAAPGGPFRGHRPCRRALPRGGLRRNRPVHREPTRHG